MIRPYANLEDRFAGCLLGHALGDALGVPFEGVPGDAIVRDLGGAHKFLNTLPLDELIYSDDTQMMIGVAECLIEKYKIDPEYLARRFGANYQPGRGYGRGVRKLLEAMADGQDYRPLLTAIFPSGSYGNGAAMRASPIGLFYHENPEQLDAEATAAAMVTHVHPLGIEGGVLFAAAVRLALLSPCTFDRTAFFAQLMIHATTEEFTWQLKTASKLGPDEQAFFGSSLPAHRSVVTAICCFASCPDSYLDAVCKAINYGDDTDTVAGMAGALVGARLGQAALPKHALELLENGPAGKDYIKHLALQLSRSFRKR